MTENFLPLKIAGRDGFCAERTAADARRQRIAIAQLLLARPWLVLMDDSAGCSVTAPARPGTTSRRLWTCSPPTHASPTVGSGHWPDNS